MQHDDVNAKEILKDSTLRNYAPFIAEYKIQPNDILSIKFESLTQDQFNFLKNDSDQNNSSISNVGAAINGELVDENGQVQFPVIGYTKLAGLTIPEAQEKLQNLANQFVSGAMVKVRILNFRFTVLGEVSQEGTINTYNTRVSLLEALGLAGGVADLADRANIKIIRMVDGYVNIQYVNILNEDYLESPYYFIHQNDIIIVPPLKQRPFRKYASQNTGLILSSISTLLLVINLMNN